MIGNWFDCGLVDYQESWGWQRRLADARARNEVPDSVLALEHPHTYTLGSSGHLENLLMDEGERERRRVSVLQVDRGGDVTYHGPGQLVAYPIFYLGRPDRSGRLPQADYVGFIRKLETVIIEAVRPFRIVSHREEGLTGAWVNMPSGPQKIAAIGIKVTAGGVSMHGLALNVNPDLDFFRGIVPCGIADKPVTSMASLLGADCPSMAEVADSLRTSFASTFEQDFQPVELNALTRE